MPRTPSPRSPRPPRRAVRGLALLLIAVLLAAAVGCAAPLDPTSSPRPTLTPEPLVPTPTPADPAASPEAETPTAAPPTPVPSPKPPSATLPAQTPAATSSAVTSEAPAPDLDGLPLPRGSGRFGVGVAIGAVTDYPVEQLGIGWYLNWGVRERPSRPRGAEFWQMIRVREDGYRPDAAAIRAAAAANPGSFWIIGNEPDVRWQDNTTPERYAELYHELYHLLKDADPTARVVIGGVSQPTPLRLAYLERILATYRARYGRRMPVDVWNVHGFILREARGSWGVDIPPGMDVEAGTLYAIDDHDDLAIFQSQIRAFRRWMADQGERDKPLVVSEYGILMPADYGFEFPTVQAFMEGSFDFFLTATDPDTGYTKDGNRLVQWWCWYSLAAPHDYYPTGNLFDPATGALTPLGAAFAAYVGP